jgi:hypothetical protein
MFIFIEKQLFADWTEDENRVETVDNAHIVNKWKLFLVGEELLSVLSLKFRRGLH